MPRDQRWFIRFSETGSVDEYARQLQYFGIQLGALFPDRGELVYLSDLTNATPSKRVETTGNDLLYFNWQGGSRRATRAPGGCRSA